MNRTRKLMIPSLATTLIHISGLAWAVDSSFDRRQDVIYGRKFGTALTMDVFTPKKDAKGVGVIMVVSGGFFSLRESIFPAFVRPLTDRGYTVFAVLHGSQPRYTIPRSFRTSTELCGSSVITPRTTGSTPPRIGITGASAGGHLSLMLGTAGDKGDPNVQDPVDRVSSRVQAVACFFSPNRFP